MRKITFLMAFFLLVIGTVSKAACSITLDTTTIAPSSIQLTKKNIALKAYESISTKKMGFWQKIKFSLAKKIVMSKMRKKMKDLDELLGMGPMGLAAGMSLLCGLGGAFFFFMGSDDDAKKYKIGAALGIGMNLLFWIVGLYPLLAGLFGLLGFALAGI
jgi:hypothetical protein